MIRGELRALTEKLFEEYKDSNSIFLSIRVSDDNPNNEVLGQSKVSAKKANTRRGLAQTGLKDIDTYELKYHEITAY